MKHGYSPSLGDLSSRLQLVRLRSWLDHKLAIGHGHVRTTIEEFRGDMIVRVRCVLGLDGDGVRTTDCRRVHRQESVAFGVGRGVPRGVGRDGRT